MTAVHQQFFHMLALRHWKSPDILKHVTDIDTVDFRNSMAIIDFLVAAKQPITLASHRFSPGWDTASLLRSELSMEKEFEAVLKGLDVSGEDAKRLVDIACAPRAAYRVWLEGEITRQHSGGMQEPTPEAFAGFLAVLIALVEQSMLHAFLFWHTGERSEADDAWRLSGAAMLYATALVKRGAITSRVPTPAPCPAIEMAQTADGVHNSDMDLVRRCTEAGRAAATFEKDSAMRRLCMRIVEDCELVLNRGKEEAFPAVFGRSPVFESFGATLSKHCN